MNTNNYLLFFTKRIKPFLIVFTVLMVSCSAKTNNEKRVQTVKSIEQEPKKESISNEATAISDENNKPNDIKNNLSAPVQEIAKTIRWFGQASVKFESKGKTIFVDPYMITGQWTADYIFITHSHGDHLSIHDIERIKKTDTKIFASQECEGKLSSLDLKDITYVLPGEVISISDNFTVETVPSYNINKTITQKLING